MNSTTSISLVAAVAAIGGFAFGWALHPGAAPEVAETAGQETVPPRSRADLRRQLIAPGEASANPAKLRQRLDEAKAGGADPQRVVMMNRLEDGYQKLRVDRDRAKLDRLDEAVGLSDEQKEQIGDLMQRRSGKANPYASDPAKGSEVMGRMAEAEGDFEAALEGLLDSDQLARLSALRQRETDNDIEAAAQADLLQVMRTIDVSEAQRDELLAVYRARHANLAAENPVGWDLYSDSLAGSGSTQAQIAPLRELVTDPELADDPARLTEALIERQAERVEAEVQLVNEILTPAQLQELRVSLEQQTSFMRLLTPPSNRNPRFMRH